ncbi:MAG TPA: BlaI/MecI/CopY family transcriptional regulator [Phycisphaerae bacterium]|nr:BlaI/MecI/CopY family transcriptional regulator [Phycisphaerae bacterium]
MPAESVITLSRRERQIMDIVFSRGRVSAAQVMAELPDPPSYSSVRTLLRILERKGHLKHRVVKGKFIYSSVYSHRRAARSALRRILETFFKNSTAAAVAALLNASDADLSQNEIAEISELIRKTTARGNRT